MRLYPDVPARRSAAIAADAADPLGDLEAGRYEGLLRAAYDEVGLTAPATSPGSPS